MTPKQDDGLIFHSLWSSHHDVAEEILSEKQNEAQHLMWSINPIHMGLQPLHLSCETIRVV